MHGWWSIRAVVLTGQVKTMRQLEDEPKKPDGCIDATANDTCPRGHAECIRYGTTNARGEQVIERYCVTCEQYHWEITAELTGDQRILADGGYERCPSCGQNPEKCYRCQKCGKDLTGRGQTTARQGVER